MKRLDTINLAEAGKLITHLKTRIRENAENLNGLNETVKLMQNSLKEDPFRKAFSPIEIQDLVEIKDLGLASIASVPTDCSQLIRSYLPRKGVFKTIVSPTKLDIISYKSFFYNPRTGTMDGGIPMDGVSTVIKQNHSMMNEFLNLDLGLIPMNNHELSSKGTLWKALNMAADSLINGFLTELGGLEAHSAGILGYDATDCVLHIVMSQTPDGISFVYGNLFTLVKLGCSCRKLLLNYHIWDGFSVFTPSLVVPDSIQDLVSALQHMDNIECHNILKFREKVSYDFQSSDVFHSSDILDGVGKAALGLFGIVPNPVGGVL